MCRYYIGIFYITIQYINCELNCAYDVINLKIEYKVCMCMFVIDLPKFVEDFTFSFCLYNFRTHATAYSSDCRRLVVRTTKCLFTVHEISMEENINLKMTSVVIMRCILLGKFT